MKRGFTVIEVLVSTVLLATGILIAMSVLSFGLKASTGSSQLTEATAFVRTMMEVSLAGGPRAPVLPGNITNPAYDNTWRPLYSPDAQAVARPFQLSDFVRSDDVRDERRFTQRAREYEVRLNVVRPAPAADDGLANVTVDIRWYDRLGRRTFTIYGVFRKS